MWGILTAMLMPMNTRKAVTKNATEQTDFDPISLFQEMDLFFEKHPDRHVLDRTLTKQLEDVARYNGNPDHRARAMELLLLRTG